MPLGTEMQGQERNDPGLYVKSYWFGGDLSLDSACLVRISARYLEIIVIYRLFNVLDHIYTMFYSLGAGILSDMHDFRKVQFASPEPVNRKWLEWFSEEFGREHFNLDMQPVPDIPFRLQGINRALP